MSLDVLFFTLRGRRCALPAAAVREVAALGNLTPVPLAPRVVRGVMPVHGQALTVLDLGVLLVPGPELHSGAVAPRCTTEKIIVAEAPASADAVAVPVALAVESVLRLGSVEEEHARPPPPGPPFVAATLLDVDGPALLVDVASVVDVVRDAVRAVVRS